jgi:hypothetical protein
MRKVRFNYRKDDGSVSERNLINPSFLKESYNSFKTFEKEEVKYVTGIEISGEVADRNERERYESAVKEYYSDYQMTLSEFVESKGLNPKNVTMKTFKKDGVSDLKFDEG